MKNSNNQYFFCALILMLLTTVACSESTIRYKIVFSSKPELMKGDKIWHIGEEIGSVGDYQLLDDGSAIVYDINIKKRHKAMMHSNSSFFVKNQALEYRAIRSEGIPLSTNVKIMAYTRELKLNLAIAKMNTNAAAEDFSVWIMDEYNAILDKIKK